MNKTVNKFKYLSCWKPQTAVTDSLNSFEKLLKSFLFIDASRHTKFAQFICILETSREDSVTSLQANLSIDR
ncbi:hypothetical protein THIOSC13_1350024 [uncultured Thiomicrorhabdus sp.]